ncbi:MAG TPA: multiheme c-type cytochrome, partial [Tepidisphaeraceae bacterium]|nr:multiheme c-type cytochrome [Tepidisphaeraceae bacterium]
MSQPTSRRFAAISVAILAVFVLLFGPISRYVKGDNAAMKTSPAMQLASLGMKFNGSASCKGSGCHNKDGDDTPPKEPLHELTIWKSQDKHAKAFETLTKKDSTDIGAKLKIADVKTSDKCLSCHALNVDKGLQGSTYSIKEGNTCESCHGPSEKWLKVHADSKWQNDERTKMDHATLLKTFGLYDTRPLIVRAELCASCHLSIDPELVTAGHPVPSFEMAYYSDIEPKHWSETHFKGPDGFINAKIWMAGQDVCLREAAEQLSSRVKAKAPTDAIASAWQQTLAHASVFQPAADVAGLDASLKSHVDALSKLKPEDGDKISAEADAIAKICEDGKAKIDAWAPDAASSTKLLQSVASLTGMATSYGQFGIDQQSMGISSLYEAVATGNNKKD